MPGVSEKRAQSIYEAGLVKVKTTPIPKGQRFKNGTFVRIAGDLGPSMRHFPKGHAFSIPMPTHTAEVNRQLKVIRS